MRTSPDIQWHHHQRRPYCNYRRSGAGRQPRHIYTRLVGSDPHGAELRYDRAGLSAGTLAITGDLTLSGTSKLEIEIGGTTQGTQYDLLSEAGTVPLTLGGQLLVRFADGFESTIQPSGSFTIVASNAAITGAFDNLVGGRIFTTDGFGSFAVSVSGSNVILGAFTVPEPSTAALLCSGLLVFRRRRAR